jgi:hypothetical protein|tara:strand:- start:675 stop:1040 length:366 start_codon:yes stop_codon:yes gene_type:complete
MAKISSFQWANQELTAELSRTYFENGFKIKELREIGRRVSGDVEFPESGEWFVGLRFKYSDGAADVLFPNIPIGEVVPLVRVYYHRKISSEAIENLLERITQEALNFDKIEFSLKSTRIQQ